MRFDDSSRKNLMLRTALALLLLMAPRGEVADTGAPAAASRDASRPKTPRPEREALAALERKVR